MALYGDPSAGGNTIYTPPKPKTPGAPGAPAAPAAPGSPAAPPPPQIPGAGTYLQQQAQAQRAYENAQNDLNYRRGAMYSEFGLLPNGQVDAASQFGKYQQMLGSDAQGIHGAKTANAARNIGTLGLGGRIMESLRNAQGAQHFGFQQTLMNNLHGFDMEGLNAQQKLAGDLLGAQQDQERWAFDHNQFTPPAESAPAEPTPATPPKKATPVKPVSNPAKQRLAQHLAAQKAKNRKGR